MADHPGDWHQGGVIGASSRRWPALTWFRCGLAVRPRRRAICSAVTSFSTVHAASMAPRVSTVLAASRCATNTAADRSPTEDERPRKEREDTESYERRVRIVVRPQRPADNDFQRCESQRDGGDLLRLQHDEEKREGKSTCGHDLSHPVSCNEQTSKVNPLRLRRVES